MGQVKGELVHAPFTPDQVKSLNHYQISGVMHPFTCGSCRDRLGVLNDGVWDDHLLVATLDGWTCPTCPYTQTWAWAWMADWTWEAAKIAGFKYPKVDR